jgi:4-amino-4-deoxy-L-arabinose transferase-like glycosyltransferase
MNDRLHGRGLWVLLALLVFASFAVRVAAWNYWQTGSIESEGAEYARIAESLRNGAGYVGLVTPGAQLIFQPLFPLLIAGTSFITHDFELAGRLVALFMGALLPLPVFGIASRLFNERVGIIAAMITLLHPMLVHLSFSVFSEGPYTTLFLFAVYLVVRALEHSSIKRWLLVGGAFGLAWLVRAEALAAFAVAVLFALAATEGNRTGRCKRALAAIVVFLVLALPQAIFIYKSTGKIGLEVKSKIFFYAGQRILAAERHPGMDYISPGGHHEVPSSAVNVKTQMRWEEKWATYGIDSHLKGRGWTMRPHAETTQEVRIPLKDVFLLVGKGIRQNAPEVLPKISSNWFGARLLPALALLGALRRPWRGPRAKSRMFVLLIAATPVLATFFAFWTEARYYFVLVPLLSIWAANGLFEIGLWLKASSAAAGWRIPASTAVSQCIVPGLIGFAMIIGSVHGARELYLFKDSALPSRVEKDVGLWIRSQQSRPVRIMDISIPLPFHAGAQFSYFPYCTGESALGYLEKAQVDYIILRRGAKFTKYYEEWLTHGIPDQRAELLQLPPVAGADKFLIFRWHRPESADSFPKTSFPARLGGTIFNEHGFV